MLVFFSLIRRHVKEAFGSCADFSGVILHKRVFPIALPCVAEIVAKPQKIILHVFKVCCFRVEPVFIHFLRLDARGCRRLDGILSKLVMNTEDVEVCVSGQGMIQCLQITQVTIDGNAKKVCGIVDRKHAAYLLLFMERICPEYVLLFPETLSPAVVCSDDSVRFVRCRDSLTS